MSSWALKYRRPLVTIALAVSLDVVAGWLFGIAEHTTTNNGWYWAVVTATTVGYGDVTPHTTVGHLLAIVVMISIIPLVTATFSLMTAGFTATHVERHSENLHRKLDHIIRHHPDIPEFGG